MGSLIRMTAIRLILYLITGIFAQKECPDDWFDAGSLGCYKFLEGKVNLTWVEAQLACEQQGGYLAEPYSQLQMEFLGELAVLEGGFTGIGFWYIGLTDLGREGEWMWIHNQADVKDEMWNMNKPNNKSRNSDDCVVMVLRNNLVNWEDHSCIAPDVSHHTVAPVCQIGTLESAVTTTTTTTTTTAVSCPSGWTEFDENCYKFYSSDRSWYESDAACLVEGATLASVHSVQEDNFLMDLSNGNTYWIGGYPKDSTWVWSDFTELDYTNYYSTSQGQCLIQKDSYYSSGWSTSSCSSYNYSYICK